MKFVGLVSGGKDSVFNILHCIRQGHELVALANLYPGQGKDEIDSFMYQTVGHDVVSFYSKCTGLPLYRREITGGSKNVKMEYCKTANDETEDLYELLREVVAHHPDVEAVSSGAILSNYQRNRVEYCCTKLGLVSLAWLWQMDQSVLMGQMCEVEAMDARIIKVAAFGLNQKHLGMKLQEIYPHLLSLNEKYGIHVCGEGGEFETLVLDAPFFTHGYLELVSHEVVDHGSEVWYLKMGVRFVERRKEMDNIDMMVSPPLLSEPFVTYPVDRFETPTNLEHDNSVAASVTNSEEHVYISNLSSQAATLEEQASEVFEKMQTELTKQGLTTENIQSSVLLLQHMSDFAAVNKIYATYFDKPLPPARVCVETCLARSVKLDLSVVVLKSFKTGVHIQSRSYWAPSNIGPYSQAVSDSEGVSTISGQIPLIPATMERSDLEYEVGLALQHFDKVRKLVDSHIDQAVVCFVVDAKYIPHVVDCWKRYSGSRRMIIVQVYGLPRGVGVEWGGLCSKSEDYIDVHFNATFEKDYHYTVLCNPMKMPAALPSTYCHVPVLAVWDSCGNHIDAATVRREVF